MMKLISAMPSPYARKVRIALAEKGLPFELVTEVPWNEGTQTPRYNPLEKLPVLLLDDGGSIYESHFILEYLERKHPVPPLLPDDTDALLAAKQFEVLADGVCDAVVLLFFERRRPAACRSAAWIDRQMRKVGGGVREIARRVGDRKWAVSDRFGLGDIAAGTVLGYLDVRLPEFKWRAAHPNLDRYAERLAERPSFRDTVPYPQTISDDVI